MALGDGVRKIEKTWIKKKSQYCTYSAGFKGCEK